VGRLVDLPAPSAASVWTLALGRRACSEEAPGRPTRKPGEHRREHRSNVLVGPTEFVGGIGIKFCAFARVFEIEIFELNWGASRLLSAGVHQSTHPRVASSTLARCARVPRGGSSRSCRGRSWSWPGRSQPSLMLPTEALMPASSRRPANANDVYWLLPGRPPPSISARRTQPRKVSAVIPKFSAIDPIAPTPSRTRHDARRPSSRPATGPHADAAASLTNGGPPRRAAHRLPLRHVEAVPTSRLY